MASFITTEHIDYFQRNQLSLVDLGGAGAGGPPPSVRRLSRIVEVGRSSPQPLSAEDEQRRDGNDAAPRNEDLIVGLSAYQIPLAFLVTSSKQGLGVHVGTWGGSNAGADERQEIVTGGVRAQFPAMRFDPEVLWPEGLTHSGLAVGVPSFNIRRWGNLSPWDRIVRAVPESPWAVLILAQAVHETACNRLRQEALNEMRAVGAASQAEGVPSPLSFTYYEMLDQYLNDLSRAMAMGAWRTAVYLLGDAGTYYRLSSLWRGVFAGSGSQGQPLRVYDTASAGQWARGWNIPEMDAEPGPGKIRHPFRLQTLLNATQLATYVDLPSIETAGFRISTVPDFDAVPPRVDPSRRIDLGPIMQRNEVTENRYPVGLEALKRHTLVAGITGAGKTNTVFHMLRQMEDQGVGFLVLEPAKTEYRSLLADRNLGDDLQVFTLGDENVAPFRLNPFEVEPGVSIATHIDLLKSVFNAAFGMWTPLPQVLERCLHAVYADFGWDTVHEANHRLPTGADYGFRALAFPTFTDLYDKAHEVVGHLGYDHRVESDIRAALLTRLNSLRIGGKGVMLDTRSSIPMSQLLEHPTVIELEQIGDDDEKAFVMGLLLVRIYEFLRSRGISERRGLEHLIVVEEAHRLLANVDSGSNIEQGNVKGKAVETFANMLSEIRAYGEGFIIAEQIPSKLAPEVIKNTNVKIIHRLVAGDDREILRQSMNMDLHQSATMATFERGVAAVFTEGDDRPVMVAVPKAKVQQPVDADNRAASTRRVRDRMRDVLPQLADLYRAFGFHPIDERRLRPYLDDARRLSDDPNFQDRFANMVLGLATDTGNVYGRVWDLIDWSRARLPDRMNSADGLTCLMLDGVRWYTNHFGQKYQWPYPALAEIQGRLAAVVVPIARSSVADTEEGDLYTDLAAFQDIYRRTCVRRGDPFPSCTRICGDNSCLYRFHCSGQLDNPLLTEQFDAALEEASGPQGWQNTSSFDSIADELVGSTTSPTVRRAVAGCFGVQRIATIPTILENRRPDALAALVEALPDAALTEEVPAS